MFYDLKIPRWDSAYKRRIAASYDPACGQAPANNYSTSRVIGLALRLQATPLTEASRC